MTSGGARRGRRDNGLVAAAYAVAGDVDPRVGEHLLDVLAVRGIAAYLQPAADLHPVTRTTTLPSRPTDRLYVDREHLATARGFLAELASEADAEEAAASDIDKAFAAIVAGFDAEIETGTWPDAEDVPHRSAGHVEDEPPDRPRLAQWTASTVSPEPGPSLLDALDSLDAMATDNEDEGYTPPPPPPIPRPSLATVLAVIGILAGFILFLSPELLPIGTPAAMVLGFVGILAGVVTLIWRLRSGDEDDDHWDPDDGAVV